MRIYQGHTYSDGKSIRTVEVIAHDNFVTDDMRVWWRSGIKKGDCLLCTFEKWAKTEIKESEVESINMNTSVRDLPSQLLMNILSLFTREELRNLAKNHDIKRGRNKSDVIFHLVRNKKLINRNVRVSI